MTSNSKFPTRGPVGAEITDFIINLVTDPLTMTNDAQAVHILNNAILKLDLAGTRQLRLTGNVPTVSASVNTPVVSVGFVTVYTTVAATYASLKVDGTKLGFSIFTGVTNGDSGWFDIPEAAKVNDVFVALLSDGGDGVADPVISSVMLHSR